MSNKWVANIVRFIVLVLLQLLVFNNLQLHGYVTPYVYILFVIQLPFQIPTAAVLLTCFLMGFIMDVFESSGGIHAASITFLAFIRPLLLRVLDPSDSYEDLDAPNIWDLGISWYFTYSFIIVMLHHVLLFWLEVFSFQNMGFTLVRGVISGAVTLIFIHIYAYIFHKSQKGLIH